MGDRGLRSEWLASSCSGSEIRVRALGEGPREGRLFLKTPPQSRLPGRVTAGLTLGCPNTRRISPQQVASQAQPPTPTPWSQRLP